MDNNNSKYSAMTGNERLSAAGLLFEFYDAVDKKNAERATNILKQVELDDDNIKDILVTLKVIGSNTGNQQ